MENDNYLHSLEDDFNEESIRERLLEAQISVFGQPDSGSEYAPSNGNSSDSEYEEGNSKRKISELSETQTSSPKRKTKENPVDRNQNGENSHVGLTDGKISKEDIGNLLINIL